MAEVTFKPNEDRVLVKAAAAEEKSAGVGEEETGTGQRWLVRCFLYPERRTEPLVPSFIAR